MGDGAKGVGDVKPGQEPILVVPPCLLNVLVEEEVVFQYPVMGHETFLRWREHLVDLTPDCQTPRQTLHGFGLGRKGRLVASFKGRARGCHLCGSNCP
ncbi:hypothetical protein TNIN_34101 [Trichonephila inaurata madagascariensis]|uniref:Uncharacterized protein n=1 Tax=Trichonephila inaurata madagascariensis TaxID=2747483 RepID=A0A8X6XQT7_9ARAC|nr:hypothetical protein TNIN_34101 [Trichonephila inaurata madagascariensis]